MSGVFTKTNTSQSFHPYCRIYLASAQSPQKWEKGDKKDDKTNSYKKNRSTDEKYVMQTINWNRWEMKGKKSEKQRKKVIVEKAKKE
jgi:hypothetical protein